MINRQGRRRSYDDLDVLCNYRDRSCRRSSGFHCPEDHEKGTPGKDRDGEKEEESEGPGRYIKNGQYALGKESEGSHGSSCFGELAL